MSGILNRLKTIIKGDAKSESPVVMDAVPIPIQKEQSFFAQKNNLMDFEEDAPEIESSNLSAHERYVFPFEVEYKGFYLQGMDEQHIIDLKDAVDDKKTDGLWTVAEFARKYLPVLDEEVEKYENDIENMPAFYKQLPKTDYGKKKTAKLSLKSAQSFTEERLVQTEDIGIQVEGVQHIELGDVNMAYINRPIGDLRDFKTFRDDYETEQEEKKKTVISNLLKGEEDAEIIE